jgi:hypothetical protein
MTVAKPAIAMPALFQVTVEGMSRVGSAGGNLEVAKTRHRGHWQGTKHLAAHAAPLRAQHAKQPPRFWVSRH